MFERAMYFVTLTVYTALVGLLLVYFKANVLWVMFFLSLLPVGLFWYLEKLNTRFIVWLLLITISTTAFFEVYAYINSLWYETSLLTIRVFGLLPVEAFFASTIHTLYFVVVYEYFFDDKKSSTRKAFPHVSYLLAGIVTLLALAISYVYLFPGLIFSYPFVLLLMLGTLVFIVAIGIFRNDWRPVGGKVLYFALSMFPVSLIYEYVALNTNLRFFANYHEYVYSFPFFGQTLPIEELFFIFLVPLWIAMVYELYLDDGQ